MHPWPITSAFAAVAVANRRHRTVPRFADVVTRGAIALDLAAARCLDDTGDGGVRPSGRAAGFPPADRVLAALDHQGVRTALVRTPVTLEQVVADFVAARWWTAPVRRARLPWRRSWGEPADGFRRSEDILTMATLLDSVFSAATDTDDVLEGAADLQLGGADWLVARVVDEVFEIRFWRAGAARSHQSDGGE